MFGFVTANVGELTEEQRSRYGAVYCGICRAMGERWGQLPRMTLQYDMVFLALLLTSLYEPEELSGKGRCVPHPLRSRPWVESDIIRYCADMNVALAYWKCVDDWQDDRKQVSRWISNRLEKSCIEIAREYPRQWKAMEKCMTELAGMEGLGCPDIDRIAACFGELMAQLLVFREDHWKNLLLQMGDGLGRFVYYMDAAVDLDRDRKKGSYNPWLTDTATYTHGYIENILVLLLDSTARYYEALPLIRDKDILDNILYSGVWVNYRNKRKEAKPHDGSV